MKGDDGFWRDVFVLYKKGSLSKIWGMGKRVCGFEQTEDCAEMVMYGILSHARFNGERLRVCKTKFQWGWRFDGQCHPATSRIKGRV